VSSKSSKDVKTYAESLEYNPKTFMTRSEAAFGFKNEF
jgi:hypothetical protein